MKNKQHIAGFILCLMVMPITACNHDDEPKAQSKTQSETGYVAGTVKDATSNQGLPNVGISVQNTRGSELESATTDANGNYDIRVPADTPLQLVFTLATHNQAVYSGVTVKADETETLEVILQIDSTIVGTGNISGTLTDAIDGQPLASAMLYFRVGINAHSGDILAETVTDSSGHYSLSDTLQTGHYTLHIMLDGYIDNFVTVLVLGGQLRSNQNAVITRSIPEGETRIVLTWGAQPSDLDSHLTGPIADNSDSRFHIYFINKGTASASPFTTLDIDDTSSYGPETITISSQFVGTYRYYVHNFSSRINTSGTSLSDSGAKVTVYQGAAQPRVFNVPSGTGTSWKVFSLSGSVITPVNGLSNNTTYSVAAVASSTGRSVEVQDEIDMIENLPFK